MGKNWVKPEIEHGKWTKYLYAVWHPENLKLGDYVDIGAGTIILAHNGVTIEDGVQIGSHCTIHSADTERGVFGPVVLKKDCRIGAGTKVYPNVTIGQSARIGANCVINADIGDGSEVKAMSLVLKDIPRGCIAKGIPAKIK
jgi:acetyltransferase-like isoleucine patch superfamily enzyme